MPSPTILLLDGEPKLASPIGAALEAEASSHGIALATRPGAPADAPIVAVLLAVDPRTPERHAARVARLRATLGGAPWIALVDPRHTPARGLAETGFHAAVRATGSPDAIASTVLRSALAARRAVDLDLVGGSAAMARVREELVLAANAPSHVLLTGETGTGKGVAARALHALSPRADAPFETVDCTVLAPTLVESELFGHERGAFTGAHERRRGRLERAGEGTLFLDEIGDLALPLQAKLLRALEERRFDRIGGREPLALRARVVAATHRDLATDVRAGRFRRDLYYRLDVLRVPLPPLRDRSEDLPVLVDHLLRRASHRLGRPPVRATPALVRALRARRWPGNVRELANRLEALAVRSRNDVLDVEDLPGVPDLLAAPDAPRTRDAPGPAPHHGAADAAVALPERGQGTPGGGAPPGRAPSTHGQASGERSELAALLRECGGNVARVARRLGRPRSTVRYRIARHGLAHLIPRD